MAERRPDRVRGTGHDTFWDWCAKSELRLPRCTACARLSWPIVEACSDCGNGEFTWERMSGAGKLVSWCTFERDYTGGVLPVPWETILVELEEGPLFISDPVGLTHCDYELGLPVRLAFIACEDAGGPFSLPVFGRA
jgi:uncharacterized OB-fold protein